MSILSQTVEKFACMGFLYIECDHNISGPKNWLRNGFDFP
jgi:hypothetical protein